MAKTDPNSELLAQFVADNAALRARLDFIESYEPIAKALRMRAATQKARDARAKARAISSAADYFALTPSEKREVPAQVLVEVCRKAKRADRVRVLDEVKLHDWRAEAQIAFALAEAPRLVEVTSHRDFEQTRSTKLKSEEQFETLKALGLPVFYAADGSPMLRGFTGGRNAVFVFDAEAWDARFEADVRLQHFVAEQQITAKRYTDDEARAYALQQYCAKHTEAQVYGLRHGLPELPAVQ